MKDPFSATNKLLPFLSVSTNMTQTKLATRRQPKLPDGLPSHLTLFIQLFDTQSPFPDQSSSSDSTSILASLSSYLPRSFPFLIPFTIVDTPRIPKTPSWRHSNNSVQTGCPNRSASAGWALAWYHQLRRESTLQYVYAFPISHTSDHSQDWHFTWCCSTTFIQGRVARSKQISFFSISTIIW